MSIKRREDSFFGLHFDCHATPESCVGLKFGEYLKAEDIEKICKDFKPDFLQIDCKGHPGYTSYPTKVGTAATEFAIDTLKLWREVTAKNDVALYMHYSGVWDTCWLKSHPDDGKICPDFDGVPDWLKDNNFTSVFSDYADKLMIPQLKELADYGADGVWVDGDCWACTVDCSENALNAFYEQTGIRLKKDDITPDNEHFEQYRCFCRDGFRNYLKHYVDEIHKYNKNFQVASNWAYSEQMPEEVKVDVDFLSGDFNPNDSFNGALFGGRVLASQGKPWDLMAWGFRRTQVNGNTQKSSYCSKHAVQLMQEAAAIMSIGGGFQVYLRQNKDTSPCMPLVNQIKPVAKFCRDRQEFCHKTKTIPNVAIFNSTHDHYVSVPKSLLFGNHGLYEPFYGWAKLLADAGHSFEIREEHNLFNCIDEYKVVICPEITTEYTFETINTLLNYAANGGVLVLAGIKTLEVFKDKAGIKFNKTDSTKSEPMLTVDDEHYDEILCDVAEIVSEGETLAKVHKGYRVLDFSTTIDFAKAINYKKGKIITIGGDFATYYSKLKTVSARQLASKLFDYYSPTARVTNSSKIVLNATKKNKSLLIQLVNSGGDHANSSVNSFDEIPALYNLDLTVNLDKKPEKVILQPSGEELEFKFDNGVLTTVVPKVEIHEIVEIK